MLIAIARIDRERSLAGLARRVYVLEGGNRAERQRRAEAALLAANPRLGTRTAFRRGQPVRVPHVPGLRRSDVVERAGTDGNGLTGQTKLRLEALQSLVKDRFQQDKEQRKELGALIGDPGFVRQARRSLRESTDLIAKTRERLETEEEQATQKAEQFEKALRTALKAVSSLDELARKAGPRS